MSKLVETLKMAEEDFEFYPTTDEQIEAMYWAIKERGKTLGAYSETRINLLEIGAGGAHVFKKLREISEAEEDRDKRLNISKYMVMEKSRILLDRMPPEAITVGVDFMDNTLIDKRADVIYCNPPYSEYAQWTERILLEANASFVYLLIPRRFGNHPGIASALKKRNATIKIVGQFDFEKAERRARAKVSLVEVDLRGRISRRLRGHYFRRDVFDGPKIDPFSLWFDETFKIEAAKEELDFREKERGEQARREHVRNSVVKGELIETLVTLYQKELAHLMANYKKVGELDSEILKELGVKAESVKKALKEKIKGLKVFYWREIFANLEAITSRLTSKTREKLMEQLAENTDIDFNQGNIRSIVIWVIKNAPKYFEEQTLSMYDMFTSEEGVKLYKSNRRFVNDSWRYLKEKAKYALDYRIVLHSWRGYTDAAGCMTDSQITAIEDLAIIAKNLGFGIKTPVVPGRKLSLKEKHTVYFEVPADRILKRGTKTQYGRIENIYIHTDKPNGNGERVMESKGVIYVYDAENKGDEVQYEIGGSFYSANSVHIDDDIFLTVRGHNNGNTHYQLNKRFIQRFNLEAGRLKGWLRSPEEAADEIDDLGIEAARRYWECSFSLLPESAEKLLPNFGGLSQSAA